MATHWINENWRVNFFKEVTLIQWNTKGYLLTAIQIFMTTDLSFTLKSWGKIDPVLWNILYIAQIIKP